MPTALLTNPVSTPRVEVSAAGNVLFRAVASQVASACVFKDENGNTLASGISGDGITWTASRALTPGTVYGVVAVMTISGSPVTSNQNIVTVAQSTLAARPVKTFDYQTQTLAAAYRTSTPLGAILDAGLTGNTFPPSDEDASLPTWPGKDISSAQAYRTQQGLPSTAIVSHPIPQNPGTLRVTRPIAGAGSLFAGRNYVKIRIKQGDHPTPTPNGNSAQLLWHDYDEALYALNGGLKKVGTDVPGKEIYFVQAFRLPSTALQPLRTYAAIIEWHTHGDGGWAPVWSVEPKMQIDDGGKLLIYQTGSRGPGDVIGTGQGGGWNGNGNLTRIYLNPSGLVPVRSSGELYDGIETSPGGGYKDNTPQPGFPLGYYGAAIRAAWNPWPTDEVFVVAIRLLHDCGPTSQFSVPAAGARAGVIQGWLWRETDPHLKPWFPAMKMPTLTVRANNTTPGIYYIQGFYRNGGETADIEHDLDYFAIGSDLASVLPPGIALGTYTPSGTSAPTNSGGGNLPTVTGSTTEGSTLTAAAGTWANTPTSYDIVWMRCDADGTNCSQVATGPTYVLTAADVLHTLKVVVTAHNDGGTGTATSAATATIQAASQTTQIGRTSLGGTWDFGGGNFLAVSGPYEVGSGGRLSTMKGHVKGGTASGKIRAVIYADSGSKPANFVAASREVSVAASQVDTEVSFVFDTAPQLPAGSYWIGYWMDGQCQENYQSVSGAGRYTPCDYSAEGLPLTTWPANGGTSFPASYALYVTFTNPLQPPTNDSAPVVGGTPVEGSALTVDSLGVWKGLTPQTPEYQWQDAPGPGFSSWSDIGSATASSYTVAVGKAGKKIRVGVRMTNADGTSAYAYSAASPVISAAAVAPVNQQKPRVIGIVEVGEVLSYDPGIWTASPTISYGQAWRANGVQVGTGATYTVPTGDAGKTITVYVTATNGVNSTSIESDPTVAVPDPRPVNTVAPTIQGTAVQGQTLSVGADGTWDGRDPQAATYQWQRDGSNIGGETGSSYLLAAGDVGHAIRVKVTMTNDYGTGVAYSAATPSVSAGSVAPYARVAPSISGVPVVGETLTGDLGEWEGSGTIGYAVKFQRSPTGAGTWADLTTGSETYTLTLADSGYDIRFVVTASNGVGAPVAANTAALAVVGSGSRNPYVSEFRARFAGLGSGTFHNVLVPVDELFTALEDDGKLDPRS